MCVCVCARARLRVCACVRVVEGKHTLEARILMCVWYAYRKRLLLSCLQGGEGLEGGFQEEVRSSAQCREDKGCYCLVRKGTCQGHGSVVSLLS